jgi:hypothetical protein
MKLILNIFFFILVLTSFSQDSINFLKKVEINILPNSIWNIDYLNNIYVSEKEMIKKLDEKGNLLFVQSLKKAGKITEIDSKNPMKILLFSEQQQYLFYLDNTLSKQGEIELEEFNLNYVTHIASSIQADKIWVFDQQDSKLKLIATKQEQSLKVQNLSGLLAIKNVYRIVEQEGRLILADSTEGVFMFDLFGTLISKFELAKTKWVNLNGNYLYVLYADNSFEIINIENSNVTKINLPEIDVLRFEINQKTIFLQTKNKITEYEINIF